MATFRVFPKKELVANSLIPSTLTAINTVDTWIFQISLANKTAVDTTVTITDGQGTPHHLLKDLPFPANSTAVIVYPHGHKMTDGVKWSAADASTVDAEIFGYQKGV